MENNMKNEEKKPTAAELPAGGIVEAGTAAQFKTGPWRSIKPVWSKEKCKACMICWIYCPDASIQVADGKVTGIDYDHCKGCGICSKECKFGAITMEAEKK